MGAYGTADAAETETSLDALRHVSAAHGVNLTDERLRVVKPVILQRLPQLLALRNFEIDDAVSPTPGIIDK